MSVAEYLDGSVRASATSVSCCGGEAGPEAVVAGELHICARCSCFHLFFSGCVYSLELGYKSASSGKMEV